MQNVDFEKEDDVKVDRPDFENHETKSSTAKWMMKNGFAKSSKSAEKRALVLALIIIIMSAVIFMYGIGKRQATDLTETGNVYLETK